MNKDVIMCAVCKKSRSHGSKNSFYRFPKDRKTLKKWMSILDLNTETTLINASICSDHFLAQHFKTGPDGASYLSNSALPIIPFKSKLDAELRPLLNSVKNQEVPENTDSDETLSMDFEARDEIARNQRKTKGSLPPDVCHLLTKRNWKAAKNVILQQKRKIKTLHDVLRRLEASVDTMNSSVKQLEENLLKSSCVGVYSTDRR